MSYFFGWICKLKHFLVELVFTVKLYKRYYISLEKYSVRTGHSFWNLRFFMDGERIKRKDTPKILKLDQNDIIEVYIDQTGGNGNTGPTEESYI